MKKNIFFIALVCLSLASAMPLLASDDDTVAYLKTVSPDAWIVMGIEAAGSSADISSLANLSDTSVTNAAKNLMAIVAAGEDFQSFPEQDLVNIIKQSYNNGQLGDSSLLNDDFWGLMALASVSNDFYKQDIAQFIVNNQNSDGGWSYAIGSESDTNDTAAAIMALKEVGYSSNDQIINKALNYLKVNQNSDGGFTYAGQSESDGASTAWVMTALNKLSIDPQTWSVGDNNPRSFLESLKLSNGSYKWLPADEQGSVLVSAYALVALNNSYYPVAYTETSSQTVEHHLWIEGPDNTICDNLVIGATVMDILINGAEVCNYEYVIENTTFGPYLRSINGYEPTGMIGWLYRVNWQAPTVGADQYVVQSGDEIYWYYASFEALPVRLTLSTEEIEPGQTVTATLEYYNGSSWQALISQLTDGSNSWSTDQAGQAEFTFNDPGVYDIYAPASEGYLKSNTIHLLVGSQASETVDLVVEILPTVDGYHDDDYLAFSIDKTQVDFGQLRRGEETRQSLTVANTGNVSFDLSTSVSGDDLLTNNLTVNNSSWRDFNRVLHPLDQFLAELGLIVPNDYSGSGFKTGQVIFWARP